MKRLAIIILAALILGGCASLKEQSIPIDHIFTQMWSWDCAPSVCPIHNQPLKETAVLITNTRDLYYDAPYEHVKKDSFPYPEESCVYVKGDIFFGKKRLLNSTPMH